MNSLGVIDSCRVWNSDPGAAKYHVIEGFGRREDKGYSFEFRALLNAGDSLHWGLYPGRTYGVFGADGLMFVQICAKCNADELQIWRFQRSITLSLLTTALPRTTTSTSMQTTAAATTSQGTSQGPSTSTTSTGQVPVVSQTQFGSFGLIGSITVVAVVAVVASALVLKRRRKTTVTSTVTLEPKPAGPATLPPPPSSQPSVPTGYAELDSMLGGGLPERYAVVIVSQSFDERDLLIRKTVESSVASGKPTFYLSDEISKTLDLVTRFRQNFYALNPMAGRIASGLDNLFKIPDVGDLSNLNISSNKIIKSKAKDEPSKIIILDLLTDLLLKNRALTTRKWLTDFAAKRKAAGFTVLATLDPSVAPKEDVQAIVGVFDGVIEVYETAPREVETILDHQEDVRQRLLRERAHARQAKTTLEPRSFLLAWGTASNEPRNLQALSPVHHAHIRPLGNGAKKKGFSDRRDRREGSSGD